MAKYIIDDLTLIDIANSIRSHRMGSGERGEDSPASPELLMRVKDMAGEIERIEGLQIPTKTIEIDAWHANVTAYSSAEVSKRVFINKKDFWTAFQQNKTRTDYRYAFAYGWSEDMFTPSREVMAKIIPEGDGSADYMFFKTALQRADNKFFDFSKTESLNHTFSSSESLVTVEADVGNVKRMEWTFADSTVLITVVLRGLSAECTFDSIFYNCPKLRNLVIDGVIGQNGFDISMCPKLTYESLISIVNALEDLTGSCETKTITMSKTNLFNIMQEDEEYIRSKGWEIAIVGL